MRDDHVAFFLPTNRISSVRSCEDRKCIGVVRLRLPPSTASSFPTYLVQAKTEKLLDVFSHSRGGIVLPFEIRLDFVVG